MSGRKRRTSEDEDEYKQKRIRNNLSVKECREKEKKKIEEAKERLEKHKAENKHLEDKLTNLQKELHVLKSLFQTTPQSDADARNPLGVEAKIEPPAPVVTPTPIPEQVTSKRTRGGKQGAKDGDTGGSNRNRIKKDKT